MNPGRILEAVLTMLGAVLLLTAADGKHPYGFFMVLRLVITVGAVYWAWRVYRVGPRAWTWMFVAVALLLNPFLPIRMQRAQWQPIDLFLGIFLIGWSGYWLFRKRTRESEIKRRAGERAKEINEANQTLSSPQERLLHDQQLDAYQQTQAPQLELPPSSQDGQAYWRPGTGAYQRAGTSTGGTAASTGTMAVSPARTLSASGWWTDSKLYRIAWAAVCVLLGLIVMVSSPDSSWVFVFVFAMIYVGFGAWWTGSTPYRITWTVVCSLLGGGFSLAVSSPDSGLGRVIVSALAFGGFACAAMLWSRGISKVLSKIGITTFGMRAMVGCLIAGAILILNLAGSLAARSSTPETQLRTNVSGASASPVPNKNNVSDASKKIVTNGVSGASTRCRPPVFTKQELFALEQQAASGDPEAQCDLGMIYIKGQGVPQDNSQAALWFRKAAEQGDAGAQFQLGYSYDNGEGVPKDYGQAALWYRKAAEQGDAHAEYSLGALYAEGVNQGTPQEDAQAVFWRSKIRAWRAYINSVVIHKSTHWRYTQAAFWYLKAAEQGDADAQDALGDLYEKGQGVAQDYAQAVLWHRKAAEQGDADAQESLGDSYLNGQGVSRDYTQAALWYRKAAEQGDADAQDALGDLYDSGRGVPRDYAEAYFWYDLAAAGEQDASDSKQVAKDRDEAASHLTPADLFREQGRAGKWFETHQAKPQ